MSHFIDQLKSNLSEKDRVIGKDRYKISSVLIPLMEIDNECHLIFQVRAQHIKQGGEVCFPGGKFDPEVDLNTKDTALRETVEEMGLSISKIDYIGKLGHYIAPMGILVDAHVGRFKIDNLNEINFNKDEVDRIFAKPIKELKKNNPEIYNVSIKVDPYSDIDGKKELLLPYEKLGLPKRYEKPWGNINHRIFVWQNEPVIWGITAELVKEFLTTI